MVTTAVHLGRKGVLVIPVGMRRALGLDEGSLVILERRPEGVLIRPAVAVPVEQYTERRRAEFVLNDAFDAASYARARARVVEMGFNPDEIPHERPDGEPGAGVP